MSRKLLFEIPEEYVSVIATALVKMPIEFAGAAWLYMSEEYDRAKRRAEIGGRTGCEQPAVNEARNGAADESSR